MPDEGDRHWRRELTLSAHSILRPRAACSPIPRGLSGTQIERLLQEIEIADTSPGMTQLRRLFNALAGAQNQH